MSALAIVIIVGAALIALTAWRMQNPRAQDRKRTAQARLPWRRS
jgi:hypothetical protein